MVKVLTMVIYLLVVSTSTTLAQIDTCIIKWWGDRTGWVASNETSRTEQARHEAFYAIFHHSHQCSGPCPSNLNCSDCDSFIPEGCDGWINCEIGPIIIINTTVEKACDEGIWDVCHYEYNQGGEHFYTQYGSWDVFCGVDTDSDGLPDNTDNCPNDHNPDQEDIYPPQGNGCGDACDCEGNFDNDEDQDGTDAATFKTDFGRSTFQDPCENGNPCNGDFDCDGDCDGTDAAGFKVDFGRSSFNNPCPACEVGVWCSYPSP